MNATLVVGHAPSAAAVGIATGVADFANINDNTVTDQRDDEYDNYHSVGKASFAHR